jgi:hypothetical protein
LELLVGGYTDADGDAARQVSYEAFAQDTNEPKYTSAYDGESDKTDMTGRKDERAREEQGRADGGWAGNGRADDGRADDGRARKGRAKTVAGFVGTT